MEFFRIKQLSWASIQFPFEVETEMEFNSFTIQLTFYLDCILYLFDKFQEKFCLSLSNFTQKKLFIFLFNYGNCK